MTNLNRMAAMKKKRNYVWVVEIDFEDGNGYEPTVDCHLTRDEARRSIKESWIYERARVTKYEATR